MAAEKTSGHDITKAKSQNPTEAHCGTTALRLVPFPSHLPPTNWVKPHHLLLYTLHNKPSHHPWLSKEDRTPSLHLGLLQAYNTINSSPTKEESISSVPPVTLSLSILGLWDKRDNRALKMSIFLSKLPICSLYFYFRAWMLSAICIANLLLPRVAAEGIGGRRPWDSNSPRLPGASRSSSQFIQDWGGDWALHKRNSSVTFTFSQGTKTKECHAGWRKPRKKE